MGTVKRDGDTIYIQHADKMRKVGVIVGGMMAEKSEGEAKDSVILMVERNRKDHLMNVWQAYGFSKEVMDHKDWFDYVQIIEYLSKDKCNIYMIPRHDLVLYGREYETDSFERQYFITLEKLRRYQV